MLIRLTSPDGRAVYLHPGLVTGLFPDQFLMADGSCVPVTRVLLALGFQVPVTETSEAIYALVSAAGDGGAAFATAVARQGVEAAVEAVRKGGSDAP
jgi:hypothetical protein